MKNNGLGKQLLSARKKMRLSRDALSKLIQVNPYTIFRIENGFGFHADTAVKIILWMPSDKATQ